MSQKNALKLKISNCFFCGKSLDTKQEKIVHRLDLKKGIKSSNVVILCPTCKYFFSNTEQKIFNFTFDFKCLEVYFKKFDRKYIQTIKQRMFNLKNREKNKCQK